MYVYVCVWEREKEREREDSMENQIDIFCNKNNCFQNQFLLRKNEIYTWRKGDEDATYFFESVFL